MSYSKIMFMGMDIFNEINLIREQLENDQINSFDKNSWNAGVNYIIDIMKILFTNYDEDYNHVVVHIPNLKNVEEFIYDDLKKLEYCKSCISKIEM